SDLEDRRHAHSVSRAVANFAKARGVRVAARVDNKSQVGWIGAANAGHRITDDVRAGIDLTTGKVGNHRANGCTGLESSGRANLARSDRGSAVRVSDCNVLRFAAGVRSSAGELIVVK